MEDKSTIGKKIRKKRLELNIRMEEASKQAGITRSTLWAIENLLSLYEKKNNDPANPTI